MNISIRQQDLKARIVLLILSEPFILPVPFYFPFLIPHIFYRQATSCRKLIAKSVQFGKMHALNYPALTQFLL